MSSWTFVGRIQPERVPLKIGTPLSSSNEVEALDLAYDCCIGIADSQVYADITVTRGNPDLNTLRNLAEGSIRTITDLIGYLHGMSFDVDIVSAISRETDERCVFGIAIPALAQRRKPEDTGKIGADLLLAMAPKPHAQMILADFREAVRIPIGTGFFCYRALEAMMQSMKSSDKENDRRGWDRLRQNLRIDRSALDRIKGHADFPRHGKLSGISDEDRTKVFIITDECIRRYLEYLRTGEKPLSERGLSSCCGQVLRPDRAVVNEIVAMIAEANRLSVR
jgi:hypothetical protein